MNVGDRVRKVTGDYGLNGTIVGKFKKLDGKIRFVVEVDLIKGHCLLYSRKNLRLLKIASRKKIKK